MSNAIADAIDSVVGIVTAPSVPTFPARESATPTAQESTRQLPLPQSSSAVPTQPSSVAPPPSSVAPPESSAPAPTTQEPAPESTSSEAQPTSEALPPSSAAPPSTTSEVVPTTREQPTSTVVETSTAATPSHTSVAGDVIASISSEIETDAPVTTTGTRTVPGLISKTTTTTRPSGSLDSANSSSSSTGLSGGAIAGIVIGVIAGIVILGLIATRFLMQRKRASRNANRASMFEPWQTAPATDEPFEKSYPMEPQPSFPNTGGDQFADPTAAFYGNQYNQGGAYPDAYGNYPAAGGYPGAEQYTNAAGAGAAGAMVGAGAYGGMQAQQPYDAGAQQVSPVSPPPDAPVNFAAPPADAAAPGVGAGAGAGAAAAGVAAGAAVGAGAAAAAAGAGTAHTASPEAAAAGLHDGMMARVKVGFVRSLEDELAITQGQQLFLHTSYDDGWCLCEDDQHNRGVVPISCLEPWTQ